jgi:hypothetical protein
MATFVPADPMTDGPRSLDVERRDGALRVRNEAGDLELSLDRPALRLGPDLLVEFGPAAGGRGSAPYSAEVLVCDPTLVRVRYATALGEGVDATVVVDLHRSRNVHLHARVRAREDVTLHDVELPAVRAAGTEPVEDGQVGRRWLQLRGSAASLGVVVKKLPWKASWNDVGAHAHSTAGSARLRAGDGGVVGLVAEGDLTLGAGDTVEGAVLLVLEDPAGDRTREEGTYTALEARYVPEGEAAQTRVWETQDVWLGPPITDGAPQRPLDQLIPRPVGMNVLARKRFTWNNEDFGLHRLTGKDSYWESGIKKAHALLATQNEHGGWYEGVEFYNLPPRHHHMYDTYIGGMFLLEAYDATGHEAFLEGALRCRDFWLGEPPANGHTEVDNGGWWYRWGGYVNELGYTDERHVLNTHSGATAFLALLYERTGDDLALEAAQRGMLAVRWGLERGIQRGDGQFLYALCQIDPTLERPGDPPYIRADLVPQIEDVYTIASSYRLMMANRLVGDEVVTDAIRRALAFWWTGHRASRTVTYRAYAAITFGVAAGEIDPVYALALPELLKDREQFTTMQRGLSSFIVPAGLPRLKVAAEGFNESLIEPVFLRQEPSRLVFALVNLEHAQRDVGVHVDLPPGREATGARVVDPAGGPTVAVDAIERTEHGVRLSVPGLREISASIVDLEF